MQTTKSIKFFANGLKIEGDRKLVKGHWCYQSAHHYSGKGEGLRFYFKGADPRTARICETVEGGRVAKYDEAGMIHDSRIALLPGDALWADALAAYAKQEERTIARLEKRLAKKGDRYTINELRRRRENLAETIAQHVAPKRAVEAAPECGHLSFLAQLGAL